MNYSELIKKLESPKVKPSYGLTVSNELHEESFTHKIVEIIKENHDVKITDSLVESFRNLAESKTFTTNKVVTEIRKISRANRLVEDRLDYVLDDGSVVLVTEETQEYINNLLKTHNDIIEYMRMSSDNFLKVIKQLRN